MAIGLGPGEGTLDFLSKSDDTILPGQKSLQLPPYWLAAYLLNPLVAPRLRKVGAPTLPCPLPLSLPPEWCLEGALSHRPWAHY